MSLLALVLSLGACDDHAAIPNEPSSASRRQDGPTQLESSFSGGISQLSLSSTTVAIGGLVNYTASVVSASTSFRGLTVRGAIVQQQVRYPVVNQGIPCGFGSTTCTFGGIISPSATTLVPGAALFELQLLNGLDSLLQTVTTGMTLVSPLTVSSVALGSTTLTIGGPFTLLTATFKNTAANISGATIQGSFVQTGTNNARRAIVGSQVQCGSGAGVVPSGTCTMASAIAVTNGSPGSGTLIPGPATFELNVLVNGTVLAQKTVPVLLRTVTTVSGLTLSSTRADTVIIEGGSVAYTAKLQNIGANLSGISIQGSVTQGTARRFADGGLVACGSTSGVLPNGTCTVSSQLTATNNTAGTGTLLSGAATFELQLVDANGRVLSASSIPLTLIEGPLESPPAGPGTELNRRIGSGTPRLARP